MCWALALGTAGSRGSSTVLKAAFGLCSFCVGKITASSLSHPFRCWGFRHALGEALGNLVERGAWDSICRILHQKLQTLIRMGKWPLWIKMLVPLRATPLFLSYLQPQWFQQVMKLSLTSSHWPPCPFPTQLLWPRIEHPDQPGWCAHP